MTDELDGIRIRRLAAVRKAAYRARSHCIIAAVACLVLAIQLIWSAVERRAPLYALFAIAALVGTLFFGRRAAKLHREATESSLGDPTTTPDFSTLSDGSQQASNLENIQD
jgi:hypothetical protein